MQEFNFLLVVTIFYRKLKPQNIKIIYVATYTLGKIDFLYYLNIRHVLLLVYTQQHMR